MLQKSDTSIESGLIELEELYIALKLAYHGNSDISEFPW